MKAKKRGRAQALRPPSGRGWREESQSQSQSQSPPVPPHPSPANAVPERAHRRRGPSAALLLLLLLAQPAPAATPRTPRTRAGAPGTGGCTGAARGRLEEAADGAARGAWSRTCGRGHANEPQKRQGALCNCLRGAGPHGRRQRRAALHVCWRGGIISRNARLRGYRLKLFRRTYREKSNRPFNNI